VPEVVFAGGALAMRCGAVVVPVLPSVVLAVS